MDWSKVKQNDVIVWIRGIGPGNAVPMFFKGRWAKDCADGTRGDIKARPVSLGQGEFTATYSPDAFELPE